jgi:hypothetical protein
MQACPPAGGFDLADDRLSSGRVEVEDTDRASLLRQPTRDRGTDAVGPAGHQDGAIL